MVPGHEQPPPVPLSHPAWPPDPDAPASTPPAKPPCPAGEPAASPVLGLDPSLPTGEGWADELQRKPANTITTHDHPIRRGGQAFIYDRLAGN